MFHLILLIVLILLAVVAVRRGTGLRDTGELGLVFILVGYCGIPMLIAAVYALFRPAQIAEWLGFAPDNPFQTFLTWAYLGMAVMATLAMRYRGVYLVGPALTWAIFFIGATSIHMHDFAARGVLTHGSMLTIFVSHGLISVLLLLGLWWSGLLGRAGGDGARDMS